jgi:hypothetical protein
VEPDERPRRPVTQTLEEFARQHYRVSDPDGREDADLLARAAAAVAAAEAGDPWRLPDVPGIPRVRYRITRPSDRGGCGPLPARGGT